MTLWRFQLICVFVSIAVNTAIPDSSNRALVVSLCINFALLLTVYQKPPRPKEV